MTAGEPCLFALQASGDFGARVADALGISLQAHEERTFEDGEHKTRPLVNVRGKNVFVLQSLYSEAQESVNDKLCRLLFFIGALRDAAANRVTVVTPYLCYARKDRRTKARDPVTTRYIAALFETVGADGIVTLDVHNSAAYENAFRCRAECLTARGLFAGYFAPLLGDRNVAVVSPDVGGIKRAEAFRETLARRLDREVGAAFLEKRRSMGTVSGGALRGDVAERTVILIDDLISTGSTLSRAAQACIAAGASTVYAAATHGIFVGDASSILAEANLEKIVITNTIPPFRVAPDLAEEKLVVLDAAALVGEAVRRMHTGESIVELMET